MWIGVCLAVVISLVPTEVASAAVALYLFIINNIGGAMTLLIPPLEMTIGLQNALTVLYPGPYVIAAGLFALTQVVLWCGGRKTQRERRRTEETSPLIQNQDSDSDFEEVEEEGDRKREGRTGGWTYVVLDDNVVRWRSSTSPSPDREMDES